MVLNKECIGDAFVACTVLGCIIVMLLFGTTHTGLLKGTTLQACLADTGAMPAFKPMFQVALKFHIYKAHTGDASRIHNNMEEVYCGDRVTTSVFTRAKQFAAQPPPVIIYPAYMTAILPGTGPYFSFVMVDPDYPKPSCKFSSM